MMSCRRLITFSLCLLLLQTVVSAREAPSFDLPLLSGDGYRSLDDLVEGRESLFLVFWESGCPHCVEGLRSGNDFSHDYAGSGIAVVGVSGDRHDPGAARERIESEGIDFLQLLDRDGATAAAYGVPLESFAVVLVDAGGGIVSMAVDPAGDVGELMESMLLDANEPEPQLQRTYVMNATSYDTDRIFGSAASGIALHGDVRMRFFSIDSRGGDAVGPYGEPVTPGNDLLVRFELEAVKSIGRYLTVGGLLRAGNEGLDVLRSGPQYFDNERGSAFAEIHASGAAFRVGYYTMHMTPLTMMRWDWDDNPRTGGDAGCGCGNAAGVLLLESLEELGPDITVEGGRLSWSGGGFELDAFYAVPRRAIETGSIAASMGLGEPADYSLEIWGGEVDWRRFDERTGRYWRAGAHFIGTWEDERSLDGPDLGYFIPFEWTRTAILTATAEAPVARWAKLRGEVIVLNDVSLHNAGGEEGRTIETSGSGGYGGVVVELPGKLEAAVDYLSIDDGYDSPFGAVSWEADRAGWRLSGRIEPPGGWSALSFFWKRLESRENLEWKDEVSFLGLAADADFENGLGGGIGWLDRGSWNDDPSAGFDETRTALTMSARYRFDRMTSLQAQFQRIEYESARAPVAESITSLFSLYVVSRF